MARWGSRRNCYLCIVLPCCIFLNITALLSDRLCKAFSSSSSSFSRYFYSVLLF